MRISCTKNHKNRKVFVGVIHKIKCGLFWDTVKVKSKTSQHQYSTQQNGPILWTNYRTNISQNARFGIQNFQNFPGISSDLFVVPQCWTQISAHAWVSKGDWLLPPRLYADANNKLASGRRYKHPRPPCSGVDTARLGSGKVGTLLRSAASCYQHQATRPRAAWRHGSRNLWINSANPRIANSFTIQPHSSGQLQYDTPYQYSVLPRVATQSGIRSTATAILSSVCLAAIHTLRWNYNVKWFYIT